MTDENPSEDSGDLTTDQVVLPDDEVARRARDRLARLAVPGAGLGALTDVVEWAAGVTGREAPAPFRVVRAVIIGGWHDGDRPPGEMGAPAGAISALADRAGASVQITGTVAGAAGPGIADRDALTSDEARLALSQGRDLADRAVDEGTDLIVLGSTDAEAEVAAAAVVAAMTGAEFPTLLGRVAGPDGRIDDVAWMRHCALVRDALRRTRERRRDARELLAALGGQALCVATALLLRAAARRTPVLLDGPVGVTAALLARDIAPQVPRWCRLADDGHHPTVRHVADILDLVPLVDLRLGLGEGAAALAALPLLQAGLSLASELPVHPAPADAEAPPENGTDVAGGDGSPDGG